MARKLRTKFPAHPEELPPLPWILCAAIGPLGKSHARMADVSFDDVEGVVYEKALYSVTEPVDLPTLHAWVEASPPLQEAIRAVCVALLDKDSALPPYRWGAPRMTNQVRCARGALLLGDAGMFNELFSRRRASYIGLMFSDGTPEGYWQLVLGKDLAGSELVPDGPAREEILRLEADWHAFGASPPGRAKGKGACGAPQGEAWEVFAALRQADMPAMQQLVEQGSALAAAGLAMLQGRWNEAALAFEQTLGWTREAMESRHARGRTPLFAYAALCVMLGKGKVRSLDAWLRHLQEEMTLMPPAFLKARADEVRAFAEHLRLVDGLLNRKSTMISGILACHAFGCLPLALAYDTLPDYVRRKVSVEVMARAADILARQGQVLLAAYAAASLHGEDLIPGWQSRMDEVMAAAKGVKLPSSRKESATETLLASLEEIAQRGSGLLWRDLPPARGQMPQVVVQHMKTYLLLRVPQAASYWAPAALSELQCYARDGHLRLDTGVAPRLMRLSAALTFGMEITGSLLPPGKRAVPARPAMVAVMQLVNTGRVSVRVCARLLPGAEPLVIPGWGLEDALVEVEGQSLIVHRNLEAEAEMERKTLKQLGIEKKQAARLMGVGSIVLDGIEPVMALLQSCRKADLPVFWQGPRCLGIYRPARPLSLRIGTELSDWLDIGAELEVDEGKVLELGALLAAFPNRRQGYLPLGGDEYVLLDEGLERQLALLDLVWQQKGKRQGIHRSALPLLEALGDGAFRKDRRRAAPAKLPAGLNAELRGYQKAGFEWLATRAEMGLGAILADDMGLGKTVQMLALLLHESQRPEAGASLVVAPVSLLGNWAAEAARFAPALPVITYEAKGQELPVELPAGTLVLISYGRLATTPEAFRRRNWNIVVLDEAQAIKNPGTQRAHAACSLDARARFCLTGTPIENSLLDLWSQMHFLNPGLFGPRESFNRKFARLEEQGRTLLRQVLAPIVLRRTKGEVLRQLPPLTETLEWVEFSTKERALYESLRRTAVKKLRSESAGSQAGIGILAELTRLRRSCCHGRLALESFAGTSSKLEAMLEKLLELKAAQRRVLVFSQFTDVLDLAEPLLAEAGITYLRLDGSTPAARRSKIVKRFQEGEADVFLISLKAGGFGLNLTAADYVLLLDPWWNPAVEDQAASRAHRMGQQQPVTLCRLVVRGTVEERILRLHREKKELAESILSPGGKGISLDVMRELLQGES